VLRLPRRYKHPVAEVVRLRSNLWAVIDLRTGASCANFNHPLHAMRLAIRLNEAANCS
jgi:hypothetical protein